MFERWKSARRAKKEAHLLMLVGTLWARGDFESRWIAWTILLGEVSSEFGSGPTGDITRFLAGHSVAKTLSELGYPDSAMSLSLCLVKGNFAWSRNSDDPDDPEGIRSLSVEEILGSRAAYYRTAFHRFRQTLQ
jgi:hypothetical protein